MVGGALGVVERHAYLVVREVERVAGLVAGSVAWFETGRLDRPFRNRIPFGVPFAKQLRLPCILVFQACRAGR